VKSSLSEQSRPLASGARVARVRPGPALAVLATAQLMVVLDSSIVYIALPSIQTDLGFSGTGLEWVVNAYTLTYGGLMLLGGRAGDLLGRRKVFLSGILLFTLASLGGGFAEDRSWLLAARAVQGIGAAVISPSALALVANTFPEGARRNRALGVYAAVSGSGAAIGLIAGGMLTDWISWRWVLFVNVPVGIGPLALSRYVPHGSLSPRRGRFDLAGAVTVTGAVTALVLALVRVPSHGWQDPTTDACLGACVLLLVAFVSVEARGRDPLVPLRMFADRKRSGSYAVMLLTAGAMFGMFFFLTQFIQVVLAFGPLRAGFAFLPTSLAIVLTTQIASRLIGRVGAAPVLLVGQILFGCGLAWLSRISVATTYAEGIAPPLVLMGLGLGCVFVPLTVTCVAGVAEGEAGLASGLLSTSQQIGGALGLATLVTVATRTTEDRMHGAAAGPGPALDACVHGWATAYGTASGLAALAALVTLVAVGGRGPREPGRHRAPR